MVVIYYIAIFIFLLVFKAWWDKRAKNNGRIISHLQSAIIDSVLYVISAWYLFDFLMMGGVVILSWGLRWFLYDLIYNFVNENRFDHLGESSKLDLWLKKQKVSQYVYKGLVILIGVVLIILGYYV